MKVQDESILLFDCTTPPERSLTGGRQHPSVEILNNHDLLTLIIQLGCERGSPATNSSVQLLLQASSVCKFWHKAVQEISVHKGLVHLRFPVTSACCGNGFLSFVRTWKRHISSLNLVDHSHWASPSLTGRDKLVSGQLVNSVTCVAASHGRTRIDAEQIALDIADCRSLTSLSIAQHHSDLLLTLCKNLQQLTRPTPLPITSNAQGLDRHSAISLAGLTSISWDLGQGGSLHRGLAAFSGLQELHLIANMITLPRGFVCRELKTLCIVAKHNVLPEYGEMVHFDRHFPNLRSLCLRAGTSHGETVHLGSFCGPNPADLPITVPALRFPEDLTHLEMDINLHCLQLVGSAVPLQALQVLKLRFYDGGIQYACNLPNLLVLELSAPDRPWIHTSLDLDMDALEVSQHLERLSVSVPCLALTADLPVSGDTLNHLARIKDLKLRYSNLQVTPELWDGLVGRHPREDHLGHGWKRLRFPEGMDQHK